MVVARAAPAMPILGKGPIPIISSGSSTMLITVDMARNTTGVLESPRPLNMALTAL